MFWAKSVENETFGYEVPEALRDHKARSKALTQMLLISFIKRRYFKTMGRSSLLLLLLSAIASVSAQTARNVRVTLDGLIIATQATGGLLIQRGRNARTSLPLPSSFVTNFDDIAVDDNNYLFALSTNSRAVCSYSRENDSFRLIGCEEPGFAVSPFTGISARDGVCVVSGGTGGMTVIEYSQDTGIIDAVPKFLNKQLPSVVGFPDVELLNGNLAALSTDFSGGLPRFGTMVVDLDNANELRNFRVADSLGFDLLIGRTNFPIVNAFYNHASGGTTYMYTANGGMTVQSPFQSDSTVVIDAPPALGSSFRAVTIAVDQKNNVLVVGGLTNGSQSVIIQYDILDNPSVPRLVSALEVSGRIASIAGNDGIIAYVGPTVDGIGLLETSSPTTGVPDSKPPSNGVPDNTAGQSSSGYAVSFSVWCVCVFVATCWF